MATRPSKKLPRDPNQRAKSIVALATGEDDEPTEKPGKDTGDPIPEKNAAAVELGRLGGLKGGKARAAKLTPEERKEIAKKAAEARWKDRRAKG
jgi:hypothetical protein